MQHATNKEPDGRTTTPNSNLWRNSQFLLLWAATTFSLTGMQMYVIVMPLLIYDMSQSALAMSGLRTLEILPNVLLGVVAGVIVDRLNRRRIMIVVTSLMLVSISVIVVLISLDTIQLWSLFALGFIYSSSGYFFGNAYHSAMPQVIPKSQLTEANAIVGFTDTFIRMIGPGLAGVLIAFTSFHGTLLVQVVCVILMISCVSALSIPNVRKVQTASPSFWREMKEGIVELFGNKLVLTPTIAILFKNLSSSMVIGVLIFFAVDYLNATEPQIGAMIGMSAVGGLIGTLIIKRLAIRITRGKIFTYVILLDILAFLSLFFAQVWWQIGIALAIQGFAIAISNVIYLALRQELTPNHLLGRVAGTSSMLMKLTMPAGILLAGLWAEWLPVPILFLISASISALLFIGMRQTRFFYEVR